MNRKIIVLFLMSTVFLIIFLSFVYNLNKKLSKPPEIIAIPVHDWTKYENGTIITVDENYIILNPPKKLEDLKELVEKYNEENPVMVPDNKQTIINRNFLRISDYTTKIWTLEKSYDIVNDHWTVDGIAFLEWGFNKETDEFELSRYSYYKRNKEGRVLKELSNWSIEH